jgi:hypothetical protein
MTRSFAAGLATVALVVLLTPGAARAQASAASIDTLFEVTRVESLLETAYSNVERMMRQSMQAATQGRAPLSEAQQKVLDAAPQKLVAVMREEMSWARMRPAMARIYSETFTQG